MFFAVVLLAFVSLFCLFCFNFTVLALTKATYRLMANAGSPYPCNSTAKLASFCENTALLLKIPKLKMV